MRLMKTRSRHLLKSENACYQEGMYAVGSRLFCVAAATPFGLFEVIDGTRAVLLDHRKQLDICTALHAWQAHTHGNKQELKPHKMNHHKDHHACTQSHSCAGIQTQTLSAMQLGRVCSKHITRSSHLHCCIPNQQYRCSIFAAHMQLLGKHRCFPGRAGHPNSLPHRCGWHAIHMKCAVYEV